MPDGQDRMPLPLLILMIVAVVTGTAIAWSFAWVVGRAFANVAGL